MDEDEIEFKRMLESSHGTSHEEEEDVEALFGEDNGHKDFSFSAKDKDRLHMLEKLRSNLVADAESKDEIKVTSPIASTFSHDSDEDDHMRL
jgi:hypothetical protein